MVKDRKSIFVYTAIVFVSLIVLNIISRDVFYRLDLTDNQQYSLSSSTKSVVKNIDDLLSIKLYFSENLPPEEANTKRYVQDLLEEYVAISKGKIQIEYFSADDDEKLQNEAVSAGIQPYQSQILENDKMEIRIVFMGLSMLYNDKKEAIPILSRNISLEYELTKRLKKLTSQGKSKIVLAKVGQQELAVQNLTQILSEVHEVNQVNLADGINENVDLAFVMDVADSLSVEEMSALAIFVEGGGKLVVGQGRINASISSFQAEPIRSNLFDLLGSWGINIQENMVLDRKCGAVTVPQQQMFGGFIPVTVNKQVNYPFLPIVESFDKDQPVVSDLEQIILLYPSEVVENDSTTFSLFSSSDNTAVMKEFYNLHFDPESNPILNQLSEDGRSLATVSTISAGADPQIITVGSSKFFTDDLGAGGANANGAFVLNAVDYLLGDSELIALRSRSVTSRPLQELDKSEKAWWKWMNMLLPMMLVILLAVYKYRSESRRSTNLQDRFE